MKEEKKELDIIGMYKEVFKDCVENVIEEYADEDYKKITKDDIEIIADKLIYKNDYVWEVINEAIHIELNNILVKRQ